MASHTALRQRGSKLSFHIVKVLECSYSYDVEHKNDITWSQCSLRAD